MKRGTVYWADMDKRRPVILLSPDARNALATDLIVVPCSTQGRAMRWHVPLASGQGGVPQACTIKCEQITTIPKRDLIGDALGVLPAAKLRAVEIAVLSAIGIQLPS